ncbi:hypothetical protein [Flavobacterium sp.]|jgi:hypothetical protein|uniref:hypothetical protein n=1 Tax=Flavobacterium sp. TaxID=239 RepID=UPI0037BF27D5
MPKIKTYRLLNFKFLFEILLIILLILFFPLMIYGNFKCLSGFWNNNYKAGFFGVFFLIINSYLFYYFSLVIYQFIKYVFYEKNTKITIDYDNRNVTIIKNTYSYIINSTNLKSVEFHLSTKHYKNLLRNFGYTKLLCKDGNEFIITNFVLDFEIIENMFNDVKKIKRLSEIIYLPS